MRSLALILAAVGALIVLTLALTYPTPTSPASDDCKEQLRLCQESAGGERAAERVLRCLSAPP